MLVLGTNGEAPFIDAGEAARIIAATRKDLPGDQVIMAGTGHPSTRHTIAATKAAAAAGADVALVVTPFYFKSQMTAEALVRHFTEVADAFADPGHAVQHPAIDGRVDADCGSGAARRASAHHRHQGFQRRRRLRHRSRHAHAAHPEGIASFPDPRRRRPQSVRGALSRRARRDPRDRQCVPRAVRHAVPTTSAPAGMPRRWNCSAR